MEIRIRFGRGRHIHRKYAKNQRLALAFASLLVPLALTAALFAVWRLAADMKWAGEFAISSGLFSHWHVWAVIAGLLAVLIYRLNRYGHRDLPPPTL